MRRAGALFAAAVVAATVWSAMAQSTVDGKQLFDRRCGGCHSLDRDKEGPRLGGVFGRKSGAVESFEYSEALKKSGIVWNVTTIDRWLTDPGKLVPNSDMNFRVTNPEERQAIIAYLQRTANPLAPCSARN